VLNRRRNRQVGALHGVVLCVKDQYDTADMRTTAGGDAGYARDRPPRDATFVSRLRAAGAIVLAKSNLGEYASGIPRSSFGGVFSCGRRSPCHVTTLCIPLAVVYGECTG
jgi:Asp-tRNA(Asn)/Glu-tRNA(Gln) amidotransferase A subunit family amidase